MKIKGILIVCVVLAILLLAKSSFFTTHQKATKPETSTALLVTTSFYPLYFFTREIVGDKATVINLTRTGGEAHDYEPSTKDIQTIENSQLLIVNGNFFESWLGQFGEQISQKNIQLLKVAEGLANLKAEKNGQEEIDAHIWLDPVLAQKEVGLISAKLQAIDPDHAVSYQKNSQQLIEKLAGLNDEFTSGLQNCQKNKIITSHAAFAYLAKRYNFEQIAIQGLNPDEDPSPAKIAAIIKLAKENNINYIFFETLVSPKIAETIALEVGATTLVFNPIESLSVAEEKSGEDYFSIQRKNLINLRLALNCQ